MSILTQIATPFATTEYLGPIASWVEILVLQPTPFCNINCDYCYLPDRNDTQRMSVDTIKAAVRMVLDAGLADHRLSIVWHAGEPMVLPVNYYEEAFGAIEQIADGKVEISHSFQSNGCLIDDSWCAFIRKNNIRIGLSIDGPAFVHDLHRKTRDGMPTHAQSMCGVEKLRENGIDFHVIAVVTADALDHADAIFRFFEQLCVSELGFNVEELEGDHASSSLTTEDATARIRRFWQRLYELSESSDGAVRIREFRRATRAILTSRAQMPWREIAEQNDQVLPFRIISVDCHGRVSTFSPELLGVHDLNYSDFAFGQVEKHDLATIRASESFQRVANEVMQGVRKCSQTCEYFSVCGGGAPSNKYFENKSLSSTTTMYCRTSIQFPIQVVLDGLESKLRRLSRSPASEGNSARNNSHSGLQR